MLFGGADAMEDSLGMMGKSLHFKEVWGYGFSKFALLRYGYVGETRLGLHFFFGVFGVQSEVFFIGASFWSHRKGIILHLAKLVCCQTVAFEGHSLAFW